MTRNNADTGKHLTAHITCGMDAAVTALRHIQYGQAATDAILYAIHKPSVRGTIACPVGAQYDTANAGRIEQVVKRTRIQSRI